MNSKIVVTGGSGNLGRAALDVLTDAGYVVLNLDVVAPQERICESWIADLNQTGDLYEACRGADAVIHLAAHQAPFVAADAEVFRNNVTATYNVFKAASDMGVRRIVHASSVAAYGFTYAQEIWNPEYLPLDETHPLFTTLYTFLASLVVMRGLLTGINFFIIEYNFVTFFIVGSLLNLNYLTIFQNIKTMTTFK